MKLSRLFVGSLLVAAAVMFAPASRAQTGPNRRQHLQPRRKVFIRATPTSGQNQRRFHGLSARLHGARTGQSDRLRRNAGPDQSVIWTFNSQRKRALVKGSSVGIGEAIAKGLLK